MRSEFARSKSLIVRKHLRTTRKRLGHTGSLCTPGSKPLALKIRLNRP